MAGRPKTRAKREAAQAKAMEMAAEMKAAELMAEQKAGEEGEVPEPRRRPCHYTEETGLKICEWLAIGKSLAAFCREPGSLSQSTVHRWLLAYGDFLEKYKIAREVQADTLVDEIVEIADANTADVNETQRNRLRVDTRKWVAAKQRPKKYGDKVEAEITG